MQVETPGGGGADSPISRRNTPRRRGRRSLRWVSTAVVVAALGRQRRGRLVLAEMTVRHTLKTLLSTTGAARARGSALSAGTLVSLSDGPGTKPSPPRRPTMGAIRGTGHPTVGSAPPTRCHPQPPFSALADGDHGSWVGDLLADPVPRDGGVSVGRRSPPERLRTVFRHSVTKPTGAKAASGAIRRG